jgi:hypothetical protein
MRAIVLAVMIIQLGLGCPGHAEQPAASDQPISATLPLFIRSSTSSPPN